MSYQANNPNGQATMVNSSPVVIASNQTTIPVSGTFWQATQPVSGTFYQATQPVSLASVPSHAVTNAGTFAVQVTSAPTTAVTGTFWQATQPVSLASVPSHAVTNAGTFAVQAAQSGTWTVGLSAAQTLATVTTVGAVTSITNALPAGTNAIGKLAANSGIDIGDVDVLSIVPGVGATNLGKQTDSAAGGTDTGVAILAIRDDALTTLTPIDGDYTRFRVTSTGRLWTSATIDAALPAGANNIGTVNINGTVPVSGTFWQATQPVNGTVTVSQPTAGNLNATVTGTVELGATSLAALENISVTIPGTVDLGTVSLTALETITVTQSTAANFLNKPYGSVTTAAPAYTTGTDNALSLTTTGSLRVDGSGVTQPVSLASVPTHGVTGTFWQATQPVSIATMPSTPVTGTFWQATQPVSLASVPSHAVTNAGTFAVQAAQSGTWNIGSITTLPALAAGTNAIGKLAANSGVVIGAVELAPATTNPTSNATTTAYAASLIVKASAGTLFTVTGYNAKTSAQFIQIHDSATLPADTAVPKIIFTVPASSNFSFDLSLPFGRNFAAGITVCNSSTGPTKTLGAADCWFDAQYK